MSQIICIGGLSRAGKDTLADLICARANKHYAKVQFSRPLKDTARAALESLGCSGDFDNEDFKADPVNRALLVAMGEAARAQNPDVFAEHAATRVGNLLMKGYGVILSDWRYMNEAKVIRHWFPEVTIRHVVVIKENSEAANETEAKTVPELYTAFPGTEFVCAQPGALTAIGERAAELVAQWNL